MSEKILPGNELLVAVPAIEINGVPYLVGESTVAPLDAPTLDILNYWQGIYRPSQLVGSVGGNISCATMDDLSVGLSDSDTDSDRTICSVGQSEEFTFYNFDAEANGFRDEDVNGDGVFNLFRDIFRAPDLPYVFVHRIGGKQTDPFALNQEIDLYYGWTDNPVPGFGDGANMTIGQTAVAKNLVNISYKIGA